MAYVQFSGKAAKTNAGPSLGRLLGYDFIRINLQNEVMSQTYQGLRLAQGTRVPFTRQQPMTNIPNSTFR